MFRIDKALDLCYYIFMQTKIEKLGDKKFLLAGRNHSGRLRWWNGKSFGSKKSAMVAKKTFRTLGEIADFSSKIVGKNHLHLA